MKNLTTILSMVLISLTGFAKTSTSTNPNISKREYPVVLPSASMEERAKAEVFQDRIDQLSDQMMAAEPGSTLWIQTKSQLQAMFKQEFANRLPDYTDQMNELSDQLMAAKPGSALWVHIKTKLSALDELQFAEAQAEFARGSR